MRSKSMSGPPVESFFLPNGMSTKHSGRAMRAAYNDCLYGWNQTGDVQARSSITSKRFLPE